MSLDDAPVEASCAPIVVCAHLDTVFPARDVTVSCSARVERLVGPGINDNGRGLAVMLALAEEIDGVRLSTRRPIDFVATTGEEGLGDLRGAKRYFDERGHDAAATIALDGAGDERIVTRALGSRRYRVSYVGSGGHSWAAFGSPNAVHAAAGAAARLAAFRLPLEPRTTLSVGRIGGGISVNSIPDHAWLEIDLRSTSAEMLDRYEREIQAAARAACEEENSRRAFGTRALSMTIQPIGTRPCGETLDRASTREARAGDDAPRRTRARRRDGVHRCERADCSRHSGDRDWCRRPWGRCAHAERVVRQHRRRPRRLASSDDRLWRRRDGGLIRHSARHFRRETIVLRDAPLQGQLG